MTNNSMRLTLALLAEHWEFSGHVVERTAPGCIECPRCWRMWFVHPLAKIPGNAPFEIVNRTRGAK